MFSSTNNPECPENNRASSTAFSEGICRISSPDSLSTTRKITWLISFSREISIRGSTCFNVSWRRVTVACTWSFVNGSLTVVSSGDFVAKTGGGVADMRRTSPVTGFCPSLTRTSFPTETVMKEALSESVEIIVGSPLFPQRRNRGFDPVSPSDCLPQ